MASELKRTTCSANHGTACFRTDRLKGCFQSQVHQLALRCLANHIAVKEMCELHESSCAQQRDSKKCGWETIIRRQPPKKKVLTPQTTRPDQGTRRSHELTGVKVMSTCPRKRTRDLHEDTSSRLVKVVDASDWRTELDASINRVAGIESLQRRRFCTDILTRDVAQFLGKRKSEGTSDSHIPVLAIRPLGLFVHRGLESYARALVRVPDDGPVSPPTDAKGHTQSAFLHSHRCAVRALMPTSSL